MNILDLFLSKETKNLQKINKLWQRYNKLLEEWEDNVAEYSILWFEFYQIETKEHKNKVELYITMITHLIDLKIKKMLWQK